MIYKSLGPPDPTHPHLGLLSLNKTFLSGGLPYKFSWDICLQTTLAEPFLESPSRFQNGLLPKYGVNGAGGEGYGMKIFCKKCSFLLLVGSARLTIILRGLLCSGVHSLLQKVVVLA